MSAADHEVCDRLRVWIEAQLGDNINDLHRVSISALIEQIWAEGFEMGWVACEKRHR